MVYDLLLGIFIGIMVGFSIGMLVAAMKPASKVNDEEYKEKLRQDSNKHTHRAVADIYAISDIMVCEECGHQWKENPFTQKRISFCPACGQQPIKEVSPRQVAEM